MKVDGGIGFDLHKAGAQAKEAGSRRVQRRVDRGDVARPVLPLLIGAEHTETIELGTSIAVAFAATR